MSSVPDIFVTSLRDHSVLLLVEVKLRSGVTDWNFNYLKTSMSRLRVPTGMLVTQEKILILRDTFQDFSEASIKQVEGELLTRNFPELQAFAVGKSRDPAAFELAVQEWLENLQDNLRKGAYSGSALDPLLAEHILPLLLEGEVRVSGPRYQKHALG